MKTCLVANLGLVEYGAAREIERRLVAARKAGAVPDVLLLCEHPHVITQGRAGQKQNLLASDRVLAQMGVNYFDTDRGGDVTYHGQMCIRDRMGMRWLDSRSSPHTPQGAGSRIEATAPPQSRRRARADARLIPMLRGRLS